MTWAVPYYEKQRLLRILRKAASGLRKPRLKLNFTHWRMDWQAELRVDVERAAANVAAAEAALQLETAQADLIMAEEAKAAALEAAHADLVKVQEAKAAELKAAEADLLKAQELLVHEKDRRIQHSEDAAVRRWMKQELSRGWMTWASLYFEEKRLLRILRKAAGGLREPRLRLNFAHWRTDWEAEIRADVERAAADVERLASEVAAAEAALEPTRQAMSDAESIAISRATELDALLSETQEARRQVLEGAAIAEAAAAAALAQARAEAEQLIEREAADAQERLKREAAEAQERLVPTPGRTNDHDSSALLHSVLLAQLICCLPPAAMSDVAWTLILAGERYRRSSQSPSSSEGRGS